eukprot:g10882.t1
MDLTQREEQVLTADDTVGSLGLVFMSLPPLPPPPMIVKHVHEGTWAENAGIGPGCEVLELGGLKAIKSRPLRIRVQPPNCGAWKQVAHFQKETVRLQFKKVMLQKALRDEHDKVKTELGIDIQAEEDRKNKNNQTKAEILQQRQRVEDQKQQLFNEMRKNALEDRNKEKQEVAGERKKLEAQKDVTSIAQEERDDLESERHRLQQQSQELLADRATFEAAVEQMKVDLEQQKARLLQERAEMEEDVEEILAQQKELQAQKAKMGSLETDLEKQKAELKASKQEISLLQEDLQKERTDFNEKLSGTISGSRWYFWLGLKCRSNPLLCIPYFTGGNGWSINDIMQKTAFWNIPLAIAVAKSWGSFSQLPLMVKSTFYWWVPDPTFLDLSPLEMIFPPYDRTARAAGNYRSGDAATTVSKGVSKDLFSLAPRVEKFLDNLQIDLSMMNAMLLDQKQTQDSWENVTCRWLRANEDIWQSWLPDDTTCFAGFGLFDDATNDFATDRTVRENKRCQACPSGTFSSQLVDLAGVTYICVACPPGTSQASGASLMCDPCDKGSYQDETGKQACKRCPVAQYQDEEGGAQCKQCPTGSRTLGLGSSYFTDCGCDEGSIDISTTPGTLICSTCQEGLHCPVMGTLPSFMSGTHPLGAEYQPAVVEGYYVKQEDPLEVYKCGKIFHCPGGLPQTCAGGREGIPCAECPAGRTWTEGSCKMCESWRQVLWGFSVVGIFLFMTVSYYLMTSKVTAKASVLFTTTCAFGMLVSLLQSVGIIGMMTVEWPVDLKGFFSYFQLLLLDLDSFGFACFAGAETSFRYVFSVMFFPTVVFWMFSNYLVSQLIPKRSWDWTKVLSCVGQFLQVTFSTMSTIALAPLMCYTHPNGLQSILKYPNVICGESEHVVMLAGGVTLLVVGVLGFLTLCTYAAVQVPHWSAREQHARVRAFRFLVFRFRLDSWWFGCQKVQRQLVAQKRQLVQVKNKLLAEKTSIETARAEMEKPCAESIVQTEGFAAVAAVEGRDQEAQTDPPPVELEDETENTDPPPPPEVVKVEAERVEVLEVASKLLANLRDPNLDPQSLEFLTDQLGKIVRAMQPGRPAEPISKKAQKLAERSHERYRSPIPRSPSMEQKLERSPLRRLSPDGPQSERTNPVCADDLMKTAPLLGVQFQQMVEEMYSC